MIFVILDRRTDFPRSAEVFIMPFTCCFPSRDVAERWLAANHPDCGFEVHSLNLKD